MAARIYEDVTGVRLPSVTTIIGRFADGGIHLCRFGKETGDFAHHYCPELEQAWEAFKHMRTLRARKLFLFRSKHLADYSVR